MNFKLLRESIDDLNSSNSTLDKIAVLANPKYNDQFILDVMIATYNPFVKYYVTSANLIKNKNLCIKHNYDIFEVLNKLSNREVTGHDAIALVNGLIENHVEYADIIYNIIDRNLKTRATTTIINKVFTDLIPTFDVVLAKKYDEHMKKVKFSDGWLASRKLDGLRCIAIIDEFGDITLRSREGNEFMTLDLVKEELSKLNLTSTVFDGEICIVDEDGNENFSAIQKEWNKKDYTIPNPRYKIFDMLTLEEFTAKKGKVKLSERLVNLSVIPENNTILSVVEQILVRDEEHLKELREKAQELGWEGIMIRKDVPYEGKRTDKLLKCKLFYDDEYIVKDVVMNVMRVIVNQAEVEEEMLSKVIIEHKGYDVSVGSGFSLEERRLYYKHPELIIGKEITVQYFEETTNEQGGLSLRFPTVKAIWEDKRNV